VSQAEPNPAKFRTASSGNPAAEFLPLHPPTTVWPGKTSYWARTGVKSAVFCSCSAGKRSSACHAN